MANLSKILLIISACIAVSGCDEIGWNPLDTSTQSESFANRPPPPTILLDFELPTLHAGATFYDEWVDSETGVMMRRRTWRGPPDNDVQASIQEMRRIDGAPLPSPPPAPDAVTEFWDTLGQRQRTFQTLYASRNAVGPVHWQRFTMGPSTCVAFSQSWGGVDDLPHRYILGYYCAAAGQALSDGQAETVIRSVRVREGDPDISPDG